MPLAAWPTWSKFAKAMHCETLAKDLPPAIDLVLLDGAKGLYPAVLALVEPNLKPGALILADNADWSPEYLDRVRSPAQGYLVGARSRRTSNCRYA